MAEVALSATVGKLAAFGAKGQAHEGSQQTQLVTATNNNDNVFEIALDKILVNIRNNKLEHIIACVNNDFVNLLAVNPLKRIVIGLVSEYLLMYARKRSICKLAIVRIRMWNHISKSASSNEHMLETWTGN